MNNKEDLKIKSSSNHDDYIAGSRFYRNAGWLFSLILLFGLIAQNLIYAIMPDKVMAAENGQVIGQVIFDEPSLRSNSEIIGDIKKWATHCNSINKNTIYGSLSICYEHMTEEMGITIVTEHSEPRYQYGAYADHISATGCINDDYTFYDESTGLISRDKYNIVEAEIKGSQICLDGAEPYHNDFYIKVKAKLIPRTSIISFGLEVSEYYDI